MKDLRAISINRELFNKPIKEFGSGAKEAKGIHIELFVPPGDVPDFVLPCYEKQTDTFKINFSYSNNEKVQELFDQNNCKAFIGLHSGKLIRLEIKGMTAEEIDRVRLTRIIAEDVSSLLEDKIQQSDVFRKKANLSKARDFLSSTAGQLADNLITSPSCGY